MSQSDLSLRIDRIGQGVAAIAEDVGAIVDSTLATHTRELGEIRQEQGRQARTLADHGDQLASIQQTLTAILQRLDQR